MRKFLETCFEGIIYCIVFIILIILIDHSHSKEIKKYEKEKKVLETKLQYLAQENTIIRKQLTEANDINYKIVTAVVNQNELLKANNQKLLKDKNTLIQKQKKTKQTPKVIDEDQPVQMMYFGKKGNNK